MAAGDPGGGDWQDPRSGGAAQRQPSYNPFGISDEFAGSTFIVRYGPGGYQAGYSGRGEGKTSVRAGQTPQFGTVSAFLGALAQDPNQVRRLQTQLLGIGILEKGGFMPGTLDDPTQKMIGFAIQMAQGANISFDEAWARLLKSGAQAFKMGGGPKGPQFRPPPFVKADPEAVDKLVDEAFQQATGRTPKKGERAKLTKVFRAWERKAYGQQLKAARAQFAGGKATVTEYRPELQVEEEAPEVAPQEAFGYQLGQVLTAMGQAIR